MRATINGQELEYEVHGSGSPVLLVMGLGMTQKAWRPQVVGLSDHHLVITFDNRGFGKSGGGKTRYEMADLADDAIGVLDHIGHHTAHIVGVSMGGMIAQHVGLRHRHRSRSLTLIATHSGAKPRAFPRAVAAKRFVAAMTARGEARSRAILKLLYPPDAIAELDLSQFSKNLVEDLGSRPNPEAVFRQIAAIAGHNTKRRLHELGTVPTLIVRPGRDILVRPSNSDRLHQRIPRSVMLSIEHAGHGVTAQCADEVNAAMLRHFSRVERAA